ncbi:MAG: DUF484 family protein [Betaproteobacteria bacterium]|nr:DUF484 family protein [Betaproteobacteria bacterium]
MRLTSDDVAQYLKDHPEFFDEYAEMLAEIFVPHPHGGRAIPIAERQIVTLRDKSRLLEDKLRELVRFGQENDAIIEKLHRLTLAMVAARDIDAFLAALYFNLREDFAVPQVALRLWAEGGWDRPEFGTASTEVRVFAESLANPYFSATPMFETRDWFGESGAELASFGYVALKAGDTFGVLALASGDPQRFRPDMGSLYVQRLGEVASAVLSRFLKVPG